MIDWFKRIKGAAAKLSLLARLFPSKTEIPFALAVIWHDTACLYLKEVGIAKEDLSLCPRLFLSAVSTICPQGKNSLAHNLQNN